MGVHFPGKQTNNPQNPGKSMQPKTKELQKQMESSRMG
jgi:hypothetical protein